MIKFIVLILVEHVGKWIFDLILSIIVKIWSKVFGKKND